MPLPAAPPAAPVLEARDVRVRRGERGGERAVVDGVSLALGRGEVLALVGPNGAGKSTLLRVLCGELRRYDGAVTFAGRALREWAPEELARARAVLPQESTLAFPFSALEVVMLGRAPFGGAAGGAAGDAALDVCLAALDAVGMGHCARRLYPTLSGGERQRVQLARVLAQVWTTDEAPAERALFLDEPTASLDLAHQQRALVLARRFADEGVGVIAVLHDLNIAAQHADRVAVLDRGRVAAVGAPGEVLRAELVEAVFGVRVAVVPNPAGRTPLLVPLPGELAVPPAR